jgi:hypothetical protein
VAFSGAAVTPSSTPKLAANSKMAGATPHRGGGGAAPSPSPAPSFFTPDGTASSPRAAAAKAAAVAAAVAAEHAGAGFGSPSRFDSPSEGVTAGAGAAALRARGGAAAAAAAGSPTLALCDAGNATLSTLSGPDLMGRAAAAGGQKPAGVQVDVSPCFSTCHAFALTCCELHRSTNP